MAECLPMDSSNKKEQFTTRRTMTGGFYPRCQHEDKNGQCNKSTYADGLCWAHYYKPGAAQTTERA